MKQYRTFVEAAELGTFAAVAARRRISVSAVSQQIRALEVELGVPLFERVGRRVRITDAGKRLAASLRDRLAAVDDALAEVASDHARASGRVAIGAPRAFARHWLIPRLPRDLQLALRFDVPSVLEAKLADGELDLAILARPAERAGVVTEPIATERFIAVSTKLRPDTLDEFARAPWIVFDRDLAMHAPWWRATFGRRAPLPTNIVAEANEVEAMLALVEAGVGLAVLPDFVVAGRPVVDVTPRGSKPATSALFLARRTTPPPARVAAVISALRQASPLPGRAATR